MQETIALGRSGYLKWPDGGDEQWEERWFRLGAERKKGADPVVTFWEMVGAACIAALCHIASDELGEQGGQGLGGLAGIAMPEEAVGWVDEAPPMEGGEYLTDEMLKVLWQKLLFWCVEKAKEAGGITAFLGAWAPKWQHVGRIFFHLAENKMNDLQPFAFMATYAVGLNASGQPTHVPLSNALKRSVKAKDKAALVHLLEPLSKASEVLPWVKELVENKTIYRPLAWTPKQAYTFLRSVPELEQCGLGIRLPNWWQKRSRPRVKAVMNADSKGLLDVHSLASIDLKIALGDNEYDVAEIEDLLSTCEDGLVFFKGQWVEVDREKLQQALAFWKDVERQAEGGALRFAQGMRLLAGVPSGQEEKAVYEQDVRSWSFAEAGEGLSQLLKAARQDVSNMEIPGLAATLRPYQKQGVAWLMFLSKLGLGACLADDMGLGKTLQILALLLRTRDGHPSLLVAPASLLSNWQAEAKRFAPDLKLVLLHGKSASDLGLFMSKGSFEGKDLVLVSYAGCTRLTWLREHTWKYVIADEAQAIKNAQTNQSRALRSFSGGMHIALTGTPIENSLTDLWSLFDFVNPGLLGSARSFQKLVKALTSSPERFAPLRRLTQPYILRRMKTDRSIIDCLPDKTEMPLFCHLTPVQAKQYQAVTETLRENLQACALGDDEAKAKRRALILQSIMLLKQICNHPNQASHSMRYDPELSGKFMALKGVCETIVARQEKVLVFTQFQEICEPLAQYMANLFGCEGLVMHGGTPVAKRRGLVERFQTPDGPPFFILSIKVGGTGLTLTEANHVIHFDRWWNPAVEDQASDRAFRIGQKKNVLVHLCMTRGTVEEKIDALIAGKRQLADEVLGTSGEVNLTSMTDEEILDFVRLDLSQCGEDV